MSLHTQRTGWTALLAIAVGLSLVSASLADPCHLWADIGEVGWLKVWDSGHYYSQGYYGPYWAVVAVRGYPSSPCDADLDAYRYWDGGTYPDCASDRLARSQAEGTWIDFVVGDFNHNPSDTTYYHVFCYEGSTGYVCKYDAHPEQLTVDGPEVSDTVDEYDFAHMWDVYLEAGGSYAFDLNASTSDIRMALFNSSGSEYWATRDSSVWDTTRDTVWVPPAADWYGLLVYADHGVEGSYDIRVGYPCGLDVLSDGSQTYGTTSWYYEYTQTSHSWNVVGMRGVTEPGLGSLWQYDTWNDQAAHPNCAETVLCASDLPYTVTQFVVADFNHSGPDTCYVLVDWEGGPGPYMIEWDGDDDELVPGETFLSQSPDADFVAEIWDVELVAGQQYLFYFNTSDPDLHMALFQGSPGSTWWTARGGSVWDVPASTLWMPSTTDVYGLCVYTDGVGSGAFDLMVTTACSYDDLLDGITTMINSEESTYLKFDPGLPEWGIVGVRPSAGSGNADMNVYRSWTNGYRPVCVDSLVGGSYTPGESVDFVVGNFAGLGIGDYYVQVDWPGAARGEYQAQWNVSGDYVGLGWSDSCAVYDSFVADIQEVFLMEGQEYTFYFDAWGADLRMALFDAFMPASVGSRADAVWDVDWTTTWTAPATGGYALVVYSESGGEGGYKVALGRPCDYVEMNDGWVYASVQDGYFSFTPTTETFGVVSVRNMGSVGDPNLYAAGAWNEDLTRPYCLTWPQIWSTQPPPDMDFLVCDFRQMSLEQQYMDLRWAVPPDEYGDIVWWQSWGELEVGVDVVALSVDELFLARVWDVYLEAGTEYLFEFTPRGSETRLALFGGSERFAWWSRADSVWDVVGDVVWTPSETGWYGLVVYNEGGGNGDFTLGTHDTPVEGYFHAELAGPTSARLRWTVPPSADARGVRLYRSVAGGDGQVRLNEEPLPLSPDEAYLDRGLWPDTEYVYEIRTVSPDGAESPMPGSTASVRTEGLDTASLLGVGPNPLVGETTVRYYVPAPGASVVLRFVNSRGAVIRTLVKEPGHPPGTAGAVWDGRDDDGVPVGSGVYFYELTVGSERRTGKVAVVR